MSMNVVRILRIANELKRHTDDLGLNDGDYQILIRVDYDEIMDVSVFDTRDVPVKYRRTQKHSQYNMTAPGWENQLAKWLWDVDLGWGLQGSIPGGPR